MIPKDKYISKQKELEDNSKHIVDEINKLSSIQQEYNSTNKLIELKNRMNQNIVDNNSCVSECLINSLISKIVVCTNKFIVKLNCSNSELDNDIYLTSLVITKDDVTEFERKHSNYKRLRLKEPIVVDIVV